MAAVELAVDVLENIEGGAEGDDEILVAIIVKVGEEGAG